MADAYQIPLEVLPNQSLTIRLSNSRYLIAIKMLNDALMAISITRDDILLIQNERLVPSTLLLPGHLALGYGNFMFITPEDAYPHYTGFDNGHELYFIPQGDGE